MKEIQLKGLVSWCFEPSQPLGIISGLKEIFIKKYIVERTYKTETRPEEQSEKTERCRLTDRRIERRKEKRKNSVATASTADMQ